jgi:phage gpG-like protein
MNTKNMDAFLRMLKESRMKVRIGILGGNATAAHPDANGKPSGLTNAEIGAIHEYGKLSDPDFPVRSFLRMPLAEKFYSEMRSSGAYRDDVVKEVLKTASFRPWLEKAGAIALGVVQDAFNTGGFGKWKPSDMRRKKNAQTLVETQQLRNSITYEVVGND